MSCSISSINYCPVKSLSFQSLNSCEIKKNIGILGDRMFAFSRSIDLDKAKFIEKDPKVRKLNNFLTLKNSPVLNKYNFTYKKGNLSLNLRDIEIISIPANDENKRLTLSNKLLDLESSLNKPIYLLSNQEYPFFDTSHSSNIFNSISLINLNSVKDFGKK